MFNCIMDNVSCLFFYLLSCILNESNFDWKRFNNTPCNYWEHMYLMVKKQGVVSVVFEAIKEVPHNIAPPKNTILRWLSLAVSIEEQNKKKYKIATDFADKLSERGIQTIVLKGPVFASYFPIPELRESEDLDCFLMDKKEEGDMVISEIGGIMKESGYKHSHLYYKGLTIENHKFLTSFDNTKLGIKTELLLQDLIKIGCHPIGETKLLSPSADFNAVFLIKHAQHHFVKEGIRVRHLLDWAFFLKAEADNVNWGRIIPLMEECRILKFAQVLTSLCIDKFKMSVDVEGLNVSDNISEAVLEDILGEQPDIFHENFFQKVLRIVRRFRRMWKFRSLADESYLRLVWNSLAFSSYLKREPKLQQ